MVAFHLFPLRRSTSVQTPRKGLAHPCSRSDEAGLSAPTNTEEFTYTMLVTFSRQYRGHPRDHTVCGCVDLCAARGSCSRTQYAVALTGFGHAERWRLVLKACRGDGFRHVNMTLTCTAVTLYDHCMSWCSCILSHLKGNRGHTCNTHT